jgi:hypothetical protein
MTIATTVLAIFAAYIGLGFLFALAFIARGIARIDAAALGAPIVFRLIVLPGCMALWPILTLKWVRARGKKVS